MRSDIYRGSCADLSASPLSWMAAEEPPPVVDLLVVVLLLDYS